MKQTLEPHRPGSGTYEFDDALTSRIDALVEARQRRTGERADVARKHVEEEVWKLGIARAEREMCA